MLSLCSFGSPHYCLVYSMQLGARTHGYFYSSRGLRQGDPLFPYFFIIAVDVFNELMMYESRNLDFVFHPKCRELGVTTLCFADDMFVVCRAHEKTMQIVTNALKEFGEMAGLKPNLEKSTSYIAGLLEAKAMQLSHVMGISLEKLPIKYLGIPLITKQLRYADCRSLIDGIREKLEVWGNKHLSFAGSLVLINTIIFGKESYWCQSLLLFAGEEIKED
ncbi:hypothetical protein LIER_25216 [Lithospermum erythrorhizon]|uniref:Reverse transcriptase domain-containing protein n=1 Tax=Lithospermum erythrorhizon TaxID=34254 RepID=A0AAV3R631_LITER